jgi:hypothetical protein
LTFSAAPFFGSPPGLLLHLLHILAQIIQHIKVTDLDALRPHKDAAIAAALEVALAVNAAVVLARRLVEGDADPGTEAGERGDGADVGDCAAAGVGGGEQAAAGFGGDGLDCG